nr:hypothetical protein [Herbiconiux sp. SYSU D00978]
MSGGEVQELLTGLVRDALSYGG